MDERGRYRLAVTGEVAKLLKHRSLRVTLPALLPDGTAPFVVGLPDDTLGYVAARAATLGAEAHLIVPAASSAAGPGGCRSVWYPPRHELQT